MGRLNVGGEILIRAEKPVAGGDMLARYDGQVVFVAGAIPGELARVRIDRLARGFAHGVVIEIDEPDPDRRDAVVDPGCGGRAYAHVRYARQLILKRDVIRDAFRRVARLTTPEGIGVAPSPQVGYRLRARLQVQDGRIGFMRAGTHELCDPASTGQLSGAALGVLAWLREWLRSVPGLRVRSIDLAENLAGDQRVLHLESDRRPFEEGLAPSLVPGVSGLCWTGPGARGDWLSGSPYVADPLGALSSDVPPGLARVAVRRHVQAFFQANRFLVPDLVGAVRAHAGSEGPVLDLYAGVGLYGLVVAATGRRDVTLVEGDRRSAADLEANAAALGLPVHVHSSSVERCLSHVTHADGLTVIVNPPRAGLSESARAGIVRLRPARVVYVSCDVATLARDVRVLIDAGWELGQMQAFDLFPNTAHVETLAALHRDAA